MSVGSDVYDLLRGNAGVTALLGSGAAIRLFPNVIAQGVAMPAAVYAVNSDPIALLDGTVGIVQSRVVVQCWAEGIAQAQSVADAVQAALQASSIPLAARDGSFDAEIGLHVETVEFDWWSSTT